MDWIVFPVVVGLVAGILLIVTIGSIASLMNLRDGAVQAIDFRGSTPPVSKVASGGNYNVTLNWVPVPIKAGSDAVFSLQVRNMSGFPLQDAKFNFIVRDSNGTLIEQFLGERISSGKGLIETRFDRASESTITVQLNSRNFKTLGDLGTANFSVKLEKSTNGSVGSRIVKIISSEKGSPFYPNPVVIRAGESITWISKELGPHTITSGENGVPDGRFDSSPGFNTLISTLDTFSHTFLHSGEFPYYCKLHPSMVGTVIVE